MPPCQSARLLRSKKRCEGTLPTRGDSLTDSFLRRFTATNRVKKTLALGHQDTLTVSLTTKEGEAAKRPHQAFLLVREASGLEAPFPFSVRESGKATVQIVCHGG